MIGPGTRLFGLVMTDPRHEGHVARLYNALFGWNGLDAAYLTFLVKAARLDFTLQGFAETGQTELLHVAPPHQLGAGRWAKHDGPVDTLRLRPALEASLQHPAVATWLDPEVVCARAHAESERWFGRPLEAPPDWLAVVDEAGFRPCKLTHDDWPRREARP